jgi:hypothetical protein
VRLPSLSVTLWLSPEPMTRPKASGSITRPVLIADLPLHDLQVLDGQEDQPEEG